MGAYFIKYWHDDGTIVSIKMALEDEIMHRLAFGEGGADSHK